MSANGSKRAVFLDRDGTLIKDVGYPRDPGSVRLLDGAVDALAAFRRAGFRLVLVSNQSGIGRGLVSPEEAAAVHARFIAELERAGVELDDVQYCPHAPEEGCPCRKPAPGLLIAAATALDLDLGSSFAIGDKESDVEAGRRAGCKTVLFAPSGAAGSGADHVAARWSDAAAFVLSSKEQP